MTQQPIFTRTESFEGENSRSSNAILKWISAIIIVIVAISAVLTVYHGVHFGLDYADKTFHPEKSYKSSVPLMILIGLLILAVVGLLRYVVSSIVGFVRRIFRIGQYDTVTIVIAFVINGVLMWINIWLTNSTIDLLERSGIDNFFTSGELFPKIVMFCTLAGALIWIPRVGTYGENRLGQFDDGDYSGYR